MGLQNSGRLVGLLLVGFMVLGGFAQVPPVPGGVRSSRLAGMSGLMQGKDPLFYVDPLSFVDPFIGTAKSAVFTRWGSEGGTYPGAAAPWGMMQLTPETKAEGGYDYGDSAIYFFSCFHHLSGFPGGSAGQIKVMPVVSTGRRDALGGRPFLHRDEKASPGYYRVIFSDDQTLVEATSSGRVGLFRFTFPAHVLPRIFVGGMGNITRKNAHLLQGTSFPVVLRYDRDDNGEEQVKDGVILRWVPSVGKPTVIVLRISVATAGLESAQKNIDKETGGLGFDAVKEKTAGQWRKELSVIDLGDGEDVRNSGNVAQDNVRETPDNNEEKKKIFYTALYHSLLMPWIISDVEGKYRGRDGLVHVTAGKNEYGQFSPWDTFRSLHPLLCLLFPDRQQDMVLSMLDIYRQTGYLPTESMTGNHAVPILVDSWLKGIRGFDSSLAYTAMAKSLVDGPFLQPDMEVYHQRGYIPFTYPESVTRTVEYAYDDWAMGQFSGIAKRGGDIPDGHPKQAIQSDGNSDPLLKRSYAYRNLFNPDEMLLLPRDKDQFKLQPGTTGYKEGDKWVYSFFVPQHPKDLVNLMGGNAAFSDRLDSALSRQSIVFDNETVFHIPYLFNYSGRPDRTEYWIRTIMDTRWSATPGGLPGNDDLGSLSSWYVLSAMGIYPVCPGKPFYDIGAPLFRTMRLHLPGGKQFVIRRRDVGTRDGGIGIRNGGAIDEGIGSWNGREERGRCVYVKSLLVNNKKFDGLLLPHEGIMQGGEMVFEMGAVPCKTSTADRGKDERKGEIGKKEQVFSVGLGTEWEGEPDFRMSDFSVTKKEVRPHELFWVRFSVSNKGSLGTKIVKLLLNGREIGRKNCVVAAGAEVTDSISCRLYPYGVAKLGIEGMKEMDVTVSGDGQETGMSMVEITGLVIRPGIKKGELQKISFTAQNIGGASRSFYIPVKVNDSLVRTDSMLLGPGEKKRLSQNLAVGGDGVQAIGVMEAREYFKVYDRDVESAVLDLAMGGDSVVDRSGFGNQGRVVRGEQMRETGGRAGRQFRGVDGGEKRDTTGLLLFGKDCYVEIPNSLSLDSIGETLTMMAWVYPVTGGEELVDIFTRGDNNVLQVVDNKRLSFFAGGWGRGDCTVDLPADWLGHWHHIAGVCEGSVLRVYIDGEQKGMSRVEGRVNLSGINKWTLGRNEEFPGKRVFNGYLDKVKLFAAPLTGEEIRGITDKE